MPIFELAYQLDSQHYFRHLADLPYAIWLDSCRALQTRGRFDVMSAQPKTVLRTRDNLTEIITNGALDKSTTNVFDLVKAQLTKLKEYAPELPFSSGALGYFAYDIGRQLEHLDNHLARDIRLPDACIGIYDWSLIVDHEQQKTVVFYSHENQLTEIKSHLANTPKKLKDFKLAQPFKENMSRKEYKFAFHKIQEHLQKGDCYQVNLCQRFSSEFSGSPFAAYLHLRQQSPAPFAGFMNLPEAAILSLSPERFIQVKNKAVLTQPIKGTMPRYADPVLDENSAQQLLSSSKDQAENLMIVDLMRNDLSRSCKPGSVKVPQLFELQSFSNVHHLVSSITGTLMQNQSALDLLKHCFPGGSITGAPKISAMKIIECLEKQARSVYCGSLGYCSTDGQMDTNIAIRSLLCDQHKIYAYAGGGIVIDSDCENEYQESLTKINNLLRALNG